jgi:hypothetical protein
MVFQRLWSGIRAFLGIAQVTPAKAKSVVPQEEIVDAHVVEVATVTAPPQPEPDPPFSRELPPGHLFLCIEQSDREWRTHGGAFQNTDVEQLYFRILHDYWFDDSFEAEEEDDDWAEENVRMLRLDTSWPQWDMYWVISQMGEDQSPRPFARFSIIRRSLEVRIEIWDETAQMYILDVEKSDQIRKAVVEHNKSLQGGWKFYAPGVYMCAPR